MTRQLCSGGHVCSHNHGDARMGGAEIGCAYVQVEERPFAWGGGGSRDRAGHARKRGPSVPGPASVASSTGNHMQSLGTLASRNNAAGLRLAGPACLHSCCSIHSASRCGALMTSRLSIHQHAHSNTPCQTYGCVPFPCMMPDYIFVSRMMIVITWHFHLDFASLHAPIAYFAATVRCIDRWHIVHAFARHALKRVQADCSPLGQHREAGRPQSPLLQQQALHQPPAQPLQARLRLLQPLLPTTAHLLSQHQLAVRMRPQQPAVPRL